MTAIIIAAQPKHHCIHVAVDAAIYKLHEQRVTAFGNKIFTVPHWPGLITAAGSSGVTTWLGISLSQMFSDFDSLIAKTEAELPGMLSKLAKDCGALPGTEIIIAGISNERGPEAYSFRINDELPLVGDREEIEASPYWADNPCELVKLDDLLMTPVPADQVVLAHYEGVDLDADPQEVIWSLRKILEMQRQMKLPPGIGGIGGFATCTSISADGITQRMLQRWPEDKLGATPIPERVDWPKWHVDNPHPTTAPVRKLRVVR